MKKWPQFWKAFIYEKKIKSSTSEVRFFKIDYFLVLLRISTKGINKSGISDDFNGGKTITNIRI